MKGFTNIIKKLDRDLIKFMSIFLGGLALYYIGISLKSATNIIDAISSFTATKASFLLELFGVKVSHYNSVIFSLDYSIKVGFGCEGTEPIALLVSAILASKSSIKSKVLGVSLGTIILLTWNDLRVVSLFIIGQNHNSYFDLMHNDILPFISVLFTLTLYLLWLKLARKK
jgi:exosortase/archaeosortase family protein